jgi:hypothetical protein
MEAQSFRAREPDWDKLEDSSGAVGVPVVHPRPVTSPRAFAFKSEARLEARRAAKQRKQEQQKDAGIKPQKRIQRERRKPLLNRGPNRTLSSEPTLTTPASPHFSIDKLSKTRAQQRAERAERRAKEAQEKAQRKREKEERAELAITEAYENTRFRFKPPSVRYAQHAAAHHPSIHLANLCIDRCAVICR